ncbi:hypothetical protein B0A55_00046 [Friedmanniomyces simplex]|uniref:Uncharacterized protein n=1 Tax=Friedmanniomyces simplex TaxID=329884 RepID=A0A4U0Y0T8_9PEZI|nr:hypothetical protein B0A55_00046 [Friedmanniomyces simplex]
MRVAEVLSDLTTLYLADPKAALALVTARDAKEGTASAEVITRHEDDDPDLKRAKDLVQLHAEVKMAHQDESGETPKAARKAEKQDDYKAQRRADEAAANVAAVQKADRKAHQNKRQRA